MLYSEAAPRSPSLEQAERVDTIVLEPGRAERHYWRDLWRYRELFAVLAWRDVSVRYKQTSIGVAWAVLRPLLTLIAFSFVFGRLAKLPSDGTAPYALMVFAGLLPWQFFSMALLDSSNSLVGNASLVSKVYFPRMIVPTAAVVVALVDFLFSFSILVALMAWYRYWPGWQLATLPLFVGLCFAASLGPGLWLTAMNVKYRDFRYIVPFFVQFGMYVSPVGFTSGIVADEWRLLYSLNPMVSVIDGFRFAILGANAPLYLPGFVLGCAVNILLLWLGVRQFRKTEKSFADVI